MRARVNASLCGSGNYYGHYGAVKLYLTSHSPDSLPVGRRGDGVFISVHAGRSRPRYSASLATAGDEAARTTADVTSK